MTRSWRLYRAVFGRSPDAAGFLYWTAVYRGGRPLARIADDFMTSAEWQQRFGNQLDDAALVDQLLQRPRTAREPEGRCQPLIGQSASRRHTQRHAAGLRRLAREHRHHRHERTDRRRRSEGAAPVRAERGSPLTTRAAHWVGLHRGGASLEALATEFVASAEWATRFGSNSTPGNSSMRCIATSSTGPATPPA
ncbi:MAG: DUF4214 domain-containing protein [Acidimicrobiales bacterium]